MVRQEIGDRYRLAASAGRFNELLPMPLGYLAAILPALHGGDRLADCLGRSCQAAELADDELCRADLRCRKAVHDPSYVFSVRFVNVENVYAMRVAGEMDSSAEAITAKTKALRERAGLSMSELAVGDGVQGRVQLPAV